MLSELLLVGPLNGPVLLGCLLLGLGVSIVSVLRLRSGSTVPLLPIVLALGLPLLFAIYAVTVQFGWGSESAIAGAEPIMKQTLLAAALSKAVYTQIIAGIVSALPALVLIGGCLSVSTLGERPRSRIAIAAATLTFLLTATALGSGAASGVWGLAAIRALLYLFAGAATTAALLSTHQKGPGAQIGPITAIALPLFIAAVDAGACGWLSREQFIRIAMAPPVEKQVLLDGIVASLGILRAFSGLSLLLALVLAALGPLASAYRSRPLVRPQVVAILSSMAVAIFVVLLASSYLVPFTYQVQ